MNNKKSFRKKKGHFGDRVLRNEKDQTEAFHSSPVNSYRPSHVRHCHEQVHIIILFIYLLIFATEKSKLYIKYPFRKCKKNPNYK